MRDLTQHLTTRADDNHAPPVFLPRRASPISRLFRRCQDLVRFFALLRIKPHTPLLVRAPVNSFEFQPCGRTPQVDYLLCLLRHGKFDLPTPSNHRLRRGLPGYLILFAPHAFEPQRQLKPSRPPSPLVFLLISTHFTATLGIPPASTSLKTCSFERDHRLSRWIRHSTYKPAYAPFTPSNSGQRSLPTYYRGCWHVVSRSFLFGYRLYSSPKTEVYNPKTVFPHAASLHQAFAHCAISPTAASRRSLGRVSVPMWPFNLSVRLPIVD